MTRLNCEPGGPRRIIGIAFKDDADGPFRHLGYAICDDASCFRVNARIVRPRRRWGPWPCVYSLRDFGPFPPIKAAIWWPALSSHTLPPLPEIRPARRFRRVR